MPRNGRSDEGARLMPKIIPHWTQKGKSQRKQGGRQAKKDGDLTERLVMQALSHYQSQGLASGLLVGPRVKQIAAPVKGIFKGVYTEKGPPDLWVQLPTESGPARHAWIEIKGRQGTSIRLDAVKAHQRAALEATEAHGNPACILVRLRYPSRPDKSGWWLVPASRWASNKESLNPEDLTAQGVRCFELIPVGRPLWGDADAPLAGPDSCPDWLRALKIIDSEPSCPWPQVW